jgi:hypothetical protein
MPETFRLPRRLKKRNQKAFERASRVSGELGRLDREQRCELLYFDESGFSPNPPVQYGWTRIGQTRSVEPLAHRQRVNVLGALRYGGQLIWTTQQRPTTRNDVIAFFDQIADQPHSAPRIVLLDNAGIHKGDAMESIAAAGPRKGCACTICHHTVQNSTASRYSGSTPSTSGVDSPASTAPTYWPRFSP